MIPTAEILKSKLCETSGRAKIGGWRNLGTVASDVERPNVTPA